MTNSKTNKLLLILIVFIGLLLRVINLNWDDGHFLHPDERLYINASSLSLPKNIQEFLSPDSPLNPNMFYYGSFPLYLYKLINAIFFPSSNLLILSRIISTAFSILTIPIIYLIGKELFSNKAGFLSSFVFAFSPGSIQYAHFNTTESLLVFLLSFIVLLSIKLAKNKIYNLIIPLGVLSGLAYATKVVGITFIMLPLTSFIILLFRKESFNRLFFKGIIFILIAVIIGLLFAPYQVIDLPQFKHEQEYMQGVIYGKFKPPFVIIYENTTPYLYPMINILPFTFGFVSFPLAFIGFLFLIRNVYIQIIKVIKQAKIYKKSVGNNVKTFKANNSLNACWLYPFILLYPLLYFFWAGSWYSKFSRYYILLFPFLSVWTSTVILKFNKWKVLLLILIALNGTMFLKIYLWPHTRIQASDYIYNNLPHGSTVAGEHWDDSLPLPLKDQPYNQYKIVQLPVYDEPDNKLKITQILSLLTESDYFVISSRRVYYSILRNPQKYPLTNKFYQLLFAEKLGFKLEKKIVNYPFFVSDDFADESFQSYDHPPVYLFKKTENLSKEELIRRINNI